MLLKLNITWLSDSKCFPSISAKVVLYLNIPFRLFWSMTLKRIAAEKFLNHHHA